MWYPALLQPILAPAPASSVTWWSLPKPKEGRSTSAPYPVRTSFKNQFSIREIIVPDGLISVLLHTFFCLNSISTSSVPEPLPSSPDKIAACPHSLGCLKCPHGQPWDGHDMTVSKFEVYLAHRLCRIFSTWMHVEEWLLFFPFPWWKRLWNNTN